MRLLIFFSTIILIFNQYAAQAQCLELVWSDEFNVGSAPNPAFWSYDLGTGDGGWGNREVQVYTSNSQNVRVSDGRLIIEALKGANGTWTSARVKTQGKFNFTYGKIAFRAKLPAGSGTWPALWMLGEDITTVSWPACGEIDVMEHVGKDPGKIHGSLHSPSSFGNTINTRTTIVNDFATEFHDYEAIWDENQITFLVDGNSYYTYNPVVKNDATWPFNDDFFIIMNIAMGGNFGSDPQYESGNLRNGIDPNLTSARMEVDYVRVYQEIEDISISGETAVQQSASGLTYSISNLADATFNWSVPADATIVSGQGTNAITVNWGTSPGEVSVEAIGQCATYNASLMVSPSATPQGASFALDDFNDDNHDRWTPEPGDGNSFALNEANGELKVTYNVTAPARNPRLTLNLEQLVDLSTYTKMRVRARTNNSSGTVAMRIDLFDNTGTATNASPVFRLEPLVDNGEYAIYEYDFAGNWASSSPVAGASVDRTNIAGLHLYINYGIFGAPGQDSVWFDFIEMVNPQVSSLPTILPAETVQIAPNPSDGIFRITLATEVFNNEEFTLQVYDYQGKILQTKRWRGVHQNVELNLKSQPTGIYFLKVQTSAGIVTKKLIRQ